MYYAHLWRLRVRWSGRDIDTYLYREECDDCELRWVFGREECLGIDGLIREV